jgi:hypothetical protein
LWKEEISALFSGEAMRICGHCCGLKISLRAAGIIGVAMSAVKRVPRAIRLREVLGWTAVIEVKWG